MQGLLDTNILIDFLRNHTPAQAWLKTQSQLGICGIVEMELIAGASNTIKQREVLNLLRDFITIEMNNADIIWATRQLTRFHLSHNVGILDCLIAAPVARLQVPFYTLNIKHFTPLLGNLVVRPY